MAAAAVAYRSTILAGRRRSMSLTMNFSALYFRVECSLTSFGCLARCDEANVPSFSGNLDKSHRARMSFLPRSRGYEFSQRSDWPQAVRCAGEHLSVRSIDVAHFFLTPQSVQNTLTQSCSDKN